MEEKKAYLVLADGHVFEGVAFGAVGDTLGELVFTTGMVGYVETLTDPSYYGQIVMQTFPQIGNYGMITQDCDRPVPFVKGYVVREWCREPSNFRCEMDIDTYLKQHGVVGICGVDTRQLTQIIRDHGVMNAMITTDPAKALPNLLQDYRITDPVAQVTCKAVHTVKAQKPRYHAALLDYGATCHIVQELNALGCDVTVYPAGAAAQDILAARPDGVVLSNGPGNPAEQQFAVAQIRKLLGQVPIFGICFGHQLLALAAGGKTEKLKYGHRGANHPVKRLRDGKTFVTLQNHGYTVVKESIAACGGVVSYVNANDGTCEGAVYPDRQAFSVQFLPEACGGPKDTEFLLEQLVELMGGESKCR